MPKVESWYFPSGDSREDEPYHHVCELKHQNTVKRWQQEGNESFYQRVMGTYSVH